MTTKEFYRLLPPAIQSILLTSEGWLVGGAVDTILKGEVPEDFDIIVPDINKYNLTIKQIHSYDPVIEINSYGGLKITADDGATLDIWPEELGHFLISANQVGHIYNHKRQILIKKV